MNYSNLIPGKPKTSGSIGKTTAHQKRWRKKAQKKYHINRSLEEKGLSLHAAKKRFGKVEKYYSGPRIQYDLSTIKKAVMLWEIHYDPKTHHYNRAEVMANDRFKYIYSKRPYHSQREGFYYLQEKLLGLVEKAIHTVMQENQLANRSQVQQKDLMDALLDMVPDRVYSDAEIDFLTTLRDHAITHQRTFTLTDKRNRANPQKVINTTLLGLHSYLEANQHFSCQDRFFLSTFLKKHPLLSYQKAYDLLHYGYRLEWIHHTDEDLIIAKSQATSLTEFNATLQKLRKLMKK